MSKTRTIQADEPKRESNVELYRIVVMIAIVAHHYVVNSGLMDSINNSPLAPNSIFLLLFGSLGKIGINCFVLITGFFMCRSNITLRKFLKLVLEWLFYKYVIMIIFCIAGYQDMSPLKIIKEMLPITSLGSNFTGCFVVFFLFIPFINLLVHNMTKKQHELIIVLSVVSFSLFATIPYMRVGMNYVIWFSVLYLVASYIRLYPVPLFSNTKFWGIMSFVALVCVCLSVVIMAYVKQGAGSASYYYFVSDSNKITALAVSICWFMFFKNIKIKYNPLINRVAASTFGVLCIHAASDSMRQWLWKDTFKNVDYFNSPYLVLHAVSTVLIVFTVCVFIDQLRIRFLEKPFFEFYDKKMAMRLEKKG